jgi:hypothetical protein
VVYTSLATRLELPCEGSDIETVVILDLMNVFSAVLDLPLVTSACPPTCLLPLLSGSLRQGCLQYIASIGWYHVGATGSLFEGGVLLGGCGVLVAGWWRCTMLSCAHAHTSRCLRGGQSTRLSSSPPARCAPHTHTHTQYHTHNITHTLSHTITALPCTAARCRTNGRGTVWLQCDKSLCLRRHRLRHLT